MLINDCRQCSALCQSRTRIVETDPVEGGLLVIGEAPGAEEDREGRGFVGRAGRTLHALLAQHGRKRGRDYGCANIVRCRPPGNRKPSPGEIQNCLPYLAETIRTCSPRAILAVGQSAASVFFGNRSLAAMIEDQRRGLPDLHPQLKPAFPDSTSATVVPMPHTSPLAWNRKAPNGKGWAEIGRKELQIVLQSGEM